MTRRGRALGFVAAGALALSMIPFGAGAGAQARAVATCKVKSFTPTKVTVGSGNVSTPVFEVQTSGCGSNPGFVIDFGGGFTIENGELLTFIAKELRNGDEGPVVATVIVGAAHKDLTFSLLRKTSFGKSVNASPEPVKKGKKVTVTGTLKRVSWDGKKLPFVGFGGRTVLVQFKANGTKSFTTIKTVRSGTGGKVKATVTAKKSGTFRLRFAGDSKDGATSSRGDAVKVVK